MSNYPIFDFVGYHKFLEPQDRFSVDHTDNVILALQFNISIFSLWFSDDFQYTLKSMVTLPMSKIIQLFRYIPFL